LGAYRWWERPTTPRKAASFTPDRGRDAKHRLAWQLNSYASSVLHAVNAQRFCAWAEGDGLGE